MPKLENAPRIFTENDFVNLFIPLLRKNGIIRLNETELKKKLYYYYLKEEYKEYFPLVNINMDRRKMRKKLKEARQRAGMTQQQMAERLDIGLRHYKKLESGEKIGRIPLWDDMEDILRVNQRVLREIHPDKEGSR